MLLNYQNENYEIVEAKEIHKNETADLVVIFKQTDYCTLEYVNHFYGVPSDLNKLVEMAKQFIDKARQ